MLTHLLQKIKHTHKRVITPFSFTLSPALGEQTLLSFTTWGFTATFPPHAARGAMESTRPPRHSRPKHHGKRSLGSRLFLRNPKADDLLTGVDYNPGMRDCLGAYGGEL